jgi:nitrate reductase NapE component
MAVTVIDTNIQAVRTAEVGAISVSFTCCVFLKLFLVTDVPEMRNRSPYNRFKVLAAVQLWVITQPSLIGGYGRFGETSVIVFTLP